MIRLRVDFRSTFGNAQATFGVEKFFLSLGRMGLAEVSGSLTRSLSAQMVAAAERAEKILTIDVTGMREKADSTMATIGSARCQMGMRDQNRIESHLILSNKRIGRCSLVPVGKKRKSFSDG